MKKAIIKHTGKIAIIFYGAPGSGKGTQANLLANYFDLVHFDTGRFLESIVHDPKKQKSKIIKRERKLFDDGKLMTPSFVLQQIRSGVKAITKSGHGLAFSGSPRTFGEAKILIPLLEKLYQKKNILVFELRIPEETSIKRNSNRIVCSI